VQDKKNNIAEIASRSQCLVDIFFKYDRDGNMRLEGNEIPSEKGSESTENDSLNQAQIRKILNDPEERKKFFASAAGMSSIWTAESEGLRNKSKLERHLLVSLLPMLEKMPRGNALRCIALLRDIQLDMDVFAKRALNGNTLTEKEYSQYIQAMSYYLSSRAEALRPEDFELLLKKLYKSNRKTANIRTFIQNVLRPKQVAELYEKISTEKPPAGKKFILVYKVAEDKFEILTKSRKFTVDEKSVIALAVVRRKGKVKLFKRNFFKSCRWLGTFGRQRLQQAINSAKATIREKEIKSRVPGLKDLYVDEIIPDEMIFALVYTEQSWSDIVLNESPEEIDKTLFMVDIMIALEGESAYAKETSNKAAKGIGQIRENTFEHLKKYFKKGTISGSYNNAVKDIDRSIYAMFLIVEVKYKMMANRLKDEDVTSADMYSYFYCGPHRFPSNALDALAIAYNNSYIRAVIYVLTGKISHISDNGRNYVKSTGRIMAHMHRSLSRAMLAEK